jgi:hypothetical protein
MNYAIEMGSGALTFIPCFIKIGSGIQKLIRGIHKQTHRQQGDLIRVLSFFQNKESKLKIIRGYLFKNICKLKNKCSTTLT